MKTLNSAHCFCYILKPAGDQKSDELLEEQRTQILPK